MFNKFPLVTAILTSALEVIFLFTPVEPIDILEFLFTKFTVLVLLPWFATTEPLIFIPPLPVLETNKVEFVPPIPEAIKPVESTNNLPFVLVIVVAPLRFETLPATLIPLAPELSIVTLPLP